MEELISKSETMENLADLIFDKPNGEYFAGVGDAMNVVAKISNAMKWIPCNKDGLANYQKEEDVLICCEKGNKYKYRYLCVGYYLDRFEREVDDLTDDEDYIEYNEEDGKFYWVDGWYERVHGWCDVESVYIEDRVVAYMSLPTKYFGE